MRDEERRRIEQEEIERAERENVFDKTAIPEIKSPKRQKQPSPEPEESDPLKHNVGDTDLQSFLEPLLAQAGGNLVALQYDFLNRALSDGTLLVCGAKLWNALHSDSWRHREAAA